MNAEEVARLLGISDKTVRRHLKKGTITATRKASGELKISDDQVEKLRLVLELEDEGRHVQSVGRPVHGVVPADRPDVVDLSIQVQTLTKELGKLQARVDVQQAHITELERRIAELEKSSQNVATPSVPSLPIVETPKPATRQNRIVEPKSTMPTVGTESWNRPAPADLPDGTLHSSDFADVLGLKRTVFDSMMKNGIGGEPLERTRIPILARPGKYKNYFTPLEQEKARELLRRHGKIE